MSIRQRVLIRFLLVLLVCAGFAYLAYRQNGSFRQGIDDADITLVYAKHVALGDGFVFNQGGERVEGFTSLLWVLLCASVTSVFSSPEFALRVLCVTLVAATHTVVTLWLDAWSIRTVSAPLRGLSVQSALYLGLVCASPAYFTWMTITLMDMCLWGTLITLTLIWLIHQQSSGGGRGGDAGVGVLLVLLMATRPESFVLCPMIIVIRSAGMLFAGAPMRVAIRSAIGPGVAFVTAGIALTAFRYLYFGYPLPNTFYAKVAPSMAYNLKMGLPYLGLFLASTPVVTVSSLVLTLALGRRLADLRRAPGKSIRSRTVRLSTPVTAITGFCAVMLLLPLATGGDHFYWWRFYQPVYPLLVLGLVCALTEVGVLGARPSAALQPQLNGQPAAVFVSIAFAFLFTTPTDSWLGPWKNTPRLRLEFEIAAKGRETGREFASAFRDLPAFPSVGVVVAGGFKYAYPGKVIDLMGLNNVAMGHSPGDRKGVKNHAAFNRTVFYQLLPDVVEPSIDSDATVTPIRAPATDWAMSEALHNLSHDPQFLLLYRYGAVRAKITADSLWLTGYFRRTLLEELTRIGTHDIRLPIAR